MKVTKNRALHTPQSPFTVVVVVVVAEFVFPLVLITDPLLGLPTHIRSILSWFSIRI